MNDIYAGDVMLYTPLAWPARGRAAVTAFAMEFHTANPGLRVALHDEFYPADGTRACWRIRLHYHNTASFYGNPPTGETGVMTETHVVRLAGGRIIEVGIPDRYSGPGVRDAAAWEIEEAIGKDTAGIYYLANTQARRPLNPYFASVKEMADA